jgi:hypothetical protein
MYASNFVQFRAAQARFSKQPCNHIYINNNNIKVSDYIINNENIDCTITIIIFI